ncbi:MAG: tyrosine-type recombinase/integrase [SAR202 cluster bacterium]|nr:tyrosine-type recombinase/integrase [SAR202 cluster bacterium]
MNKILRRLLNWAVRKKIAINVPPLTTELMKELRSEFKNSQPHVEERVLSNRDVQLILDNSSGTYEEIIVHLQILHELRIAEALTLRHEDIDLINNEIHVRYQNRDGDLTPVKTERSRRSVPLQRPTKMLLLQQYRSFQDGCVYSTHDGLPIRYNNYNHRFFKPLMKNST